MARVVVIFAILALITGAMFWLARIPSQHPDVVATIPVASSETPKATPEHSSESATPTTTANGADAIPPADAATTASAVPADAAATASVPALPTSGAEANILQQSTTVSGAQTGIVVEDVQASGESSIALRGRADPGGTVKVSVNDKPSGEVTVGSAGSWSVTVDKGTGVPEPKIVLELIGSDGKVLDKTNFVFKTVTAPPLSPQDHTLITAQGTAPAPEQVHTPKRAHRKTLRVRRGESLWRIAKRHYGNGEKWRKIFEANKGRIGDDPDYVQAGTRLVLPS